MGYGVWNMTFDYIGNKDIGAWAVARRQLVYISLATIISITRIAKSGGSLSVETAVECIRRLPVGCRSRLVSPR